MYSRGVPHDMIMGELKKYKNSNPYALKYEQYAEEGEDVDTVKDHMDFNLKSMAPEGSDIFYFNPIDGTYGTVDAFGNRVSIIDGQGLYNHSNKISSIKAYKDEHYIKTATESIMGKAVDNFKESMRGEIESFHIFTGDIFRDGTFNEFISRGTPIVPNQKDYERVPLKPAEGLFQWLTRTYGWRDGSFGPLETRRRKK
jgi:hypothetical protein